MAKKSNTRSKSKSPAKGKAQEEQERIVTMEALNEGASSDDEMPPEEEWNVEARALRQAISDGAFDKIVKDSKKKTKGGNDEDDDDESFEDVVLNDEESEEEEEEDEEAEEQQQEEESASEEEQGDLRKLVAGDGSDSEEEQDEEDDEVEDTIERRNVMSSKALLVVTEEHMAIKRKMPWGEKFVVVAKTPLPFGASVEDGGTPLDIHDDLKREVAFYDMAMEAVVAARGACKKAGIPFTRPDDFFAEMVKTDDHMAKVKDRLIFENKKIEAVAARKSNKEQKLRATESKTNRLAEKAKKKKDHFKALDDWAASAAQNRGRGMEDEDGGRGHNKKREAADKKYGHGGKRGRFKQNDSKSMNDMSGFNARGNFAGGSKKTSGGAGGNRQGKRARDASRSRR